MTLSESLRKEFLLPVSGAFRPSYFRYLGFRDHLSEPIALLRARGIHALFSLPPAHIHESDLIVGCLRGVHVEETPDNQILLKHAASLTQALRTRDFSTNLDHYAPDYRHTLAVGLPGLFHEVDESLARHAGDSEKIETLNAMRLSLEGFSNLISAYAQKAAQLSGAPGYDEKRLEAIQKNCLALLSAPPVHFTQALQLVWFCHTAFMMEGRYAMALGRMDQYLYPFFEKDIASGALTQEDAVQLLENVFTKIPTTDVVNICIGGQDIDGNCQVNDLSRCILQAVRNCNAPGPNLSARITQNTPDDFLMACLKSIGTGLGYPALMNDDVNIAALKAYGYEEADVYDYCMVGCIENFLPGLQPPWSDGRFDAPRYFDYVFNRGVSEFNQSAGLDLGDVEDIHSMEEFLSRFEAQLAYGASEYCARFQAANASIHQSYYAEPFLSCFCQGCIEKAKDINCGGAKYPSIHGVALMGAGTIADSLAAIEKVVFTDHAATLKELKDALNHNFQGYELLREKLLAAPKYGNGDDFVDRYAVWYLDFLSSVFSRYKTRDGGGVYTAMAANTSNIFAGHVISATPDGRLAGTPLSDAASPTYGRDVRGATVTLTSLSKPHYEKCACGTVVNQKFSPSMFEGEKCKKLLSLVKAYFKMSGQEIQMNATSPAILRDAMAHPENYQNLVVRVSGFSDYFVRLHKDVQMDILSRTQHE